MIGFALLGLGSLLTVDLYQRYNDVSRQEQARLVSLAAALNANMSEQLRASARMLDVLAQFEPALLKERDGLARLNQRMGLLSESVIGIRTILRVNAEGIGVASNRSELIGNDFSGGTRYSAIRAGNNPLVLYVSEPYTTPLGTYTIGLGKAVHNDRGEFGGYFLAVLSPDYFGVLMKSLLYAPDMRLSVAHGDGKIIYSTQSSPDIRGVDLTSKPDSLFNRHRAGGQQSSFMIDNATATNDLRFVAIHSVFPNGLRADKPLIVAVSRDASAVFSEWRTSVARTVALFAGIVMVVCLGYLGYARRKAAFGHVLEQKERVQKHAESIAHSERFIRTITDAMPGLVAYFDLELRCCFANKAYLDWYQMSASAMIGTRLVDLLGESLFERNKSHIDAALAGERQQFERFLTKRDGSVGHVLATYIPDDDGHGQIKGFVLLVTDIKALRLAEADLKVAASVFENTADGIMVTDANGVILSVNPAFTVITGYPAHEAVGQTPRLFRSNHHDAAFHTSVWRQIAEHGHWKGEIWNRRKNGEIFPMWQAITRIADESTQSGRYISVFQDITESWRQNERNRHLAFHDALTDLPNRALLLERLDRQIVMAQRQPRGLAVLFLDLDGFKRVNDTLGHAVGDDLLQVVAGRLLGLVRQTDTVARFGGDEFVVLLDNPANEDEVLKIATRIIAAINEPMAFGGTQATVGTSIGVALYPQHGASANDLLKHADEAMYQAKHGGKNRYCLATAVAVRV